ncbi:hypothetical protein [Pacificibacter sp. AS14]
MFRLDFQQRGNLVTFSFEGVLRRAGRKAIGNFRFGRFLRVALNAPQ